MGRQLYRRAINFDLDDKRLQENYPNKSYKRAYEDIRSFLTENGFTHRQYSGYISNNPVSERYAISVVRKLAREHEWFVPSLQKLDLTVELETFDLKKLLDKEFGGSGSIKEEKISITLSKTYCQQVPDKIHEGETFNIVTIPKGTLLGGKDISGYIINPKLMYENPYNPNEMVAQYNTEHLTDNSIMLKNLNEATSEKVDIKELKAAIDAQREDYKAMKQQQNEKQPSINKNKEKDKGEEL